MKFVVFELNFFFLLLVVFLKVKFVYFGDEVVLNKCIFM